MRAGKFDRKVSVRAPTSTARSTDGQPIITWTTVLSSVWAEVQPIQGKEWFANSQRYSEVDKRVVIRWTTLVTAIKPNCILVESKDGSLWDIQSVTDINDERRAIELTVIKVV